MYRHNAKVNGKEYKVGKLLCFDENDSLDIQRSQKTRFSFSYKF
jgi:hypothetical protein